MKVRTTGPATERVSALKRLGNPAPANSNRFRTAAATVPVVNDARELLSSRKKPIFDARQLLSRQTSATGPRQNAANDNQHTVVITGVKNTKMKDGRFMTGSSSTEKKKQIFSVGPSTFVTIRNANSSQKSLQSTEPVSFTKTITNTAVRREDDDRGSRANQSFSSLADQKVVISVVNDHYQKKPPSPPPPPPARASSPPVRHHNPPPIVKRLHDASIQTAHASGSSRSPIRMSSHRRHTSTAMEEHDDSIDYDQQDDLYEPPVKHTISSTVSARKTTASNDQQALAAAAKGSVKRTSTGAPVSTRTASSVVAKPTPPAATTVLVTNLQPSVTEDDVIELFGQVGRIIEITTLSRGCVQIIYAQREHGEQAVAKYHNRLLDGQFMYVSLQQTNKEPSSYSTTKSNKTSSLVTPAQQLKPTLSQPPPPPTKENGSLATAAGTSSSSTQPLKLNASSSTASSSSNKIVIDPTFIRQALFHPTNNSTNPVQFQVKL